MVTLSDLEKMRRAQKSIERQVFNNLEKIWARLDFSDLKKAKEEFYIQALKLVNDTGTVGAQAAVEWYDLLRQKANPSEDYKAQGGVGPDVEAIAGSVDYAFHDVYKKKGSDKTLQALKSSMTRYALNMVRATVLYNSDKDPAHVRFARIPKEPCCAFCAMLASRGFVYLTVETAGEFTKFHDDCHCVVTPGWSDEKVLHNIRGVDFLSDTTDFYDPDRFYEEYSAAREVAKQEKPGRVETKRILAHMRRMFPFTYSDGVINLDYKYISFSPNMPSFSEEVKEDIIGFLVEKKILSGSVESMQKHEVWGTLMMSRHGHEVEWIDDVSSVSSNDFIWVSNGGKEFDLKMRKNAPSSEDAWEKEPRRIMFRILNDIKKHPHKKRFVVHMNRVVEVPENFVPELRSAVLGIEKNKVEELWLIYGDYLTQVF